jgi:ribulose 1,5-bisphosphate synthetase/thiazole synthase
MYDQSTQRIEEEMMDYYHEPARDIPIRHEVDVLVVGAGPAGVSAAICAARQGARMLLIEQTGMAGGIATAGLMSHWTGRSAEIGIYKEILDRSADGERRQVINPEKLRTALLEMLVEAGVTVQFYTFASAPIMEEREIRGVVTESKSGREAVRAKIVVDASGDGDIAARAGAPFHKGRESDGKMQPMTLMFKVGGVETEHVTRFVGQFEESYPTPEGDIQSLARQHLPFPAGHLLIYRASLPGVVTCNMTNCIDVDGTDVADLTQAELTCRRQIEPIVRFLRRYVTGFERCYLLDTASLIGVRETRHFIGEYTLTEQDILNARVFEDWVVARVHFNFDVHNVSGSGLDATGAQERFAQERYYTIPYRCFVPKEVDNLLLAGRDISGTHLAHSNFRVMPICAQMGQAAGIAAAICAREGICPRDLDARRVQAILVAQGVQL